jgi:hypothetical protein
MNKSALVLAVAAAMPVLARAAGPDPISVTPRPTAAETRARQYQPWLNQINQPYANQLGAFNGKGVLIGVADTGAEISHVELKGQIVKAYNVFDGSSNISDGVGHGTHVAGLLAGTLANGAAMQGVAPGAQLAMAKVFSSSGSTTSDRIDAGINWLVNTAKAPIVSLSLGGSSAGNTAAIRNGVAKGSLFVIAAGNDDKNAVSWPARFASQSWANNQIIVVGAVDASNRLASFSNYGIDTARWFVVAPGVGINSSYLGGRYAGMSGTSMATPMVAGQAALIKSEWGFLGASQISQIIFKTATRLGKGTDTTPDPVYGWGLVNVAKSLSPIGNLQAVSGGKLLVLNGATMVSSVGVASATPIKVTGLDDFGRGYTVDLGRSVQSTTSQGASATTLFAAVDRQAALVEKVQDGVTLSYAPDGSAMALSQKTARGTEIGFGAGGMSGKFFGLEASGLTPLELNQSGKFNAPYYAMLKDASHAGVSFAVGGGSRLRFGAVSESAVTVERFGPNFNEHNQRFLSSAEWEQKLGRAVGILSVGVLRENGSMLGSVQGQAMALNARPTTTFTSVSLGYALTASSSLVAMASSGRTAGFGNADSLISQVSAVRTTAYSIGLATSRIFNNQDRFGLAFSVPARVRSGDVILSGSVAQNSDSGALSFGSQVLNLRPTAIERDTELTYSTMFGRDGRLGKVTGAIMWRINPGHDATARPDWLMGVRYGKAF